MLQDGAGVDYVEASFLADRQYEDLDPTDNCPAPPNGTSLAIFQVLGFEDHTGELPFLPNESFGKFALATYAPSAGIFLGAAVFDFDTHTVNHADMLPGFTASVADGRLEMDVTDSHGAGVVHQQYRRLQMDGQKGEGLLVVQTYPDGRKRANYTLASRIDGSASFDSNNMQAARKRAPKSLKAAVGPWKSSSAKSRGSPIGCSGASKAKASRQIAGSCPESASSAKKGASRRSAMSGSVSAPSKSSGASTGSAAGT